MSKQLRELQARKAALIQEARALTECAATDNRDMSDEEVSAFDALKARIDSASGAIDRESSLIAEEAQMAIGALNHPRNAHITVTDNRQAQ
jgi:HK97 family phage major capsid protein